MQRANEAQGQRFSGCIQRRFTLVELLIILAVISVLSSLLLTSIGAAAAGAKRVQCENNLRQLQGTVDAYLNDSHKIFAWSMYTDYAGAYWFRMLAYYSYLSNPAIGICPSTAPWTYYPNSASRWWACYGGNTNMLNATSHTWGSGAIGSVVTPRLFYTKRVRSPSTFHMFMDSFRANWVYLPGSITPVDGQNHMVTSLSEIASTHEGRTSAAFLDGHVAQQSAADFLAAGFSP